MLNRGNILQIAFVVVYSAWIGTAFYVPSPTPNWWLAPRPMTRDNPSACKSAHVILCASYQEQLARARAEKAARQAGGGAVPQPQYQPPSDAYRASYPSPAKQAQQAQTVSYSPQEEQQRNRPPHSGSPLPQETNEAVATLLNLLGERLGTGQPLAPEKVRVFTAAAEAVIKEARGIGYSVNTPVGQQQQVYQSQAQTFYSPQQPRQPEQPQPHHHQDYPRHQSQAPSFTASGFEQDENIPWEMGSRTLTGPAPGFRAASAYQPAGAGGFDEEGDDFETYGLPQPVTRQKESPFMETLKGTPFYVDIAEQPVSSDEYLRIIQSRIKAAQMKRRQEQAHTGIESANHYMDELNRKKQERLRLEAEQARQWQEGGQ